MRDYRFAVYIMASYSGTLYIGFAGDLYPRVMQHKRGEGGKFAAKYGCTRLVYYECHRYAMNGIKREKYLKGLTRAKKIALIESINPKWIDLATDWGKPIQPLSSASKGSFAPANSASAQDDSANLKERAAVRAVATGRNS